MPLAIRTLTAWISELVLVISSRRCRSLRTGHRLPLDRPVRLHIGTNKKTLFSISSGYDCHCEAKYVPGTRYEYIYIYS